ncbi:MAG: right-handed parallel beta-helix repeat-containing protein [Candidatus Aminicenantes bacterium]|nr:right-handed parallel beta-helix repeat-containing protein [Candidatus Aminicenantes bacterium]
MKKMTLPITGTVYLLLLFPFFLMQDECPPPPATLPDTVYVDAMNGSDVYGQRGIKESSYKTIQRGIGSTRANDDTVLVFEGTYNENIDFGGRKIVVKSESGPEKTIIHGTGVGDVVTCENSPGCTLQGFTITGSENSWYKAGISANSDMTIRNNIITGNWVGIKTSNYYKPLIVNNLIHNNFVYGITAQYYSEPTIIHNTIAYNGEDGISSYSGAGSVVNNIIFSNGKNGIFCSMPELAPEISHNDVFGNQGSNYYGCFPGEGDISSDPMFIDSGLNDFHLSNTSPCLAAAKLDVNTPDIDLEGKWRINPPYSCPDMGAYENSDGGGDFHLTISTGAGGTTTPLPGSYGCCEGTTVDVEAFPDKYYIFLEWTGDFLLENKKNKYLNFTMDFNKSIMANFKLIHSPLNVAGQKVINRSLSQIEYINVLIWQPNPNNDNLEAHYIYLIEEGQIELMAKVSAGVYEFMHRKVDKNKTYTYSVVAIIGDREGIPAYVTVK